MVIVSDSSVTSDNAFRKYYISLDSPVIRQDYFIYNRENNIQ